MSNDGEARTWRLAAAEGSPEQLAARAELLAGRRIDAVGVLVRITPAETLARWRSLQPHANP